jgi:hypothetical protein
VIRSKPHPEQGYRSALGLLRLADRFDKVRLEKACERAIAIRAPGYRTVKIIRARTRTHRSAMREPSPTREGSASLGLKPAASISMAREACSPFSVAELFLHPLREPEHPRELAPRWDNSASRDMKLSGSTNRFRGPFGKRVARGRRIT